VFPDKNLVVVVTAGAGRRDEQELNRLQRDYVLPAVHQDGPLEPDPEAEAQLQATVEVAARPPVAQPAPPLPEAARRIAGKRYVLDPNPHLSQYMSAFVLSFPKEDEALLTRYRGKVTSRLPVGLDGVYRIVPGRFGLPAALKGSWQDANTLVIRFNELGNINNWRLRLRFEDDRVRGELRDDTGLGAWPVSGKVQP
jgi:hypothetical protein